MERRVSRAALVLAALAAVAGGAGRCLAGRGLAASFELVARMKSPTPKDLHEGLVESAATERVAEALVALGLAGLVGLLVARLAGSRGRAAAAAAVVVACGTVAVLAPTVLVADLLVPGSARARLDAGPGASEPTVTIAVKPVSPAEPDDLSGSTRTLIVHSVRDDDGRWVVVARGETLAADRLAGWLAGEVDLEREKRALEAGARIPVRVQLRSPSTCPRALEAGYLAALRGACPEGSGVLVELVRVPDEAEVAAQRAAAIRAEREPFATAALVGTLARLAAAAVLALAAFAAWRKGRAPWPLLVGPGLLALAQLLALPAFLHAAVATDVARDWTAGEVAARVSPVAALVVLSGLAVVVGAGVLAYALSRSADAEAPTAASRPRARERATPAKARAVAPAASSVSRTARRGSAARSSARRPSRA